MSTKGATTEQDAASQATSSGPCSGTRGGASQASSSGAFGGSGLPRTSVGAVEQDCIEQHQQEAEGDRGRHVLGVSRFGCRGDERSCDAGTPHGEFGSQGLKANLCYGKLEADAKR